MRVWWWIAGGSLVLLPLWFYSYVSRAIESDHSRLVPSGSAAEARARGVHIRNLAVADSTLGWNGRRLRLHEAWVEEVTQVHFVLGLPGTERLERLGMYRLAFVLTDERGEGLPFGEAVDLTGALCVLAEGTPPYGLGKGAGGSDPFFTYSEEPPRHLRLATTSPPCPERSPGADTPSAPD